MGNVAVLGKLTDFGDTITLVPQSGIQFVEYGFDLDTLPSFKRRFIERAGAPRAEDGLVEYRLLPNWDDDNPDPKAAGPHEELFSDDVYDINTDHVLKLFLNEWIPVPFLRVDQNRDRFGNETYLPGPADWARVRVVESREAHGDREGTHRVVFAFDTALAERRPNRPYLGISPQDAEQRESFRFVHRLKHIAPFLENIVEKPGGGTMDTQAWLKTWLEELFTDLKKREKAARNKPLTEDDFPHHLEHMARYIAFLSLLARLVAPAKVTLVNSVGKDPLTGDLLVTPIDVDLILDIGNSRSCGLLIQSFPNDDSTDLNRSLVLELRNLGAPELVYRDPFESHIELMQAEFGREDLAKRSGRDRAFFWPSFVRLGPEAAERRAEAEGTEAVSSLSSPKRYLWDAEPVTQDWRIRGPSEAARAESLIQRTIYKYVNNRGDVLSQLEDDRLNKQLRLKVAPADLQNADKLRFSRSAFFSFMLMEIIAQAMMMINNPAVRRRDREKDYPRRLRRIIMTIPSATPVQEQRIIRSRTEAALKLYWSLMGWEGGAPGVYPRPEVHAAWDEASSVHLVYLYGEITQKLGGNILSLFRFHGKERVRTDHEGNPLAGAAPEESLRIASVDIGGGTTDLMVTTYFQRNNRALIPVQNFREGFRKAGDDLVKRVIERVVGPAIEARLTECGAADAHMLMSELFSGDRPGTAQADRHLRRQFTLKLLRPVALGVLAACEEAGSSLRPQPARSYASFLPGGEAALVPGGRILDYLEAFAASRKVRGFRLADVSIPIEPGKVVECIHTEFSRIFENIAEAIHKLDADVVLLTGRPSCLPGVVSLFANQLGIGLDRIVPISAYRVGNWYPFRQTGRGLIADPKTTAVVGGMLCALASKRQLDNFTMDTHGLAMRSTARFIGEIDTDMTMPEAKTYFSNVDLDSRNGMTASFDFYAPARLGYRQLPREDWVSTPLYRLRFRPGADLDKVKLPLKVTLERELADEDDDHDSSAARSLAIMQSEATREEFGVESAVDDGGKGTDRRRIMELKLDTSTGGADGVYWLDSGILWSA